MVVDSVLGSVREGVVVVKVVDDVWEERLRGDTKSRFSGRQSQVTCSLLHAFRDEKSTTDGGSARGCCSRGRAFDVRIGSRKS